MTFILVIKKQEEIYSQKQKFSINIKNNTNISKNKRVIFFWELYHRFFDGIQNKNLHDFWFGMTSKCNRIHTGWEIDLEA